MTFEGPTRLVRAVNRTQLHDADAARAEVGRRHLAATVIEQIARDTMRRTPVALADRARLLFRRYFSEGNWTIDDERSLAALVGRGQGWYQIPCDEHLVVEYGWRAAGFHVRCRTATAAPTATDHQLPTTLDRQRARIGEIASVEDTIATINRPRNDTAATAAPTGTEAAPIRHARTLSESFDFTVIPETTHDAATVCFLTGPGRRVPNRQWLRRSYDQQPPETNDPFLSLLFESVPVVVGALPEPDSVSIELSQATEWNNYLGVVLGLVIDHAAPIVHAVRATRVDERARNEFRALDLQNPAAAVRVRDALNDRDPVLRELAVFAVGTTEPFTAPRVWRDAIDDSARSVRRGAIKAILAHAEERLRPLMERALHDVDACTRFHAVHAIARIGADKSRFELQELQHDPDARVRLAAVAALRSERLPR